MVHVLVLASWGRCFPAAAFRGHASALHLLPSLVPPPRRCFQEAEAGMLVCFQKSLTTLTAGTQTAEKHDGKLPNRSRYRGRYCVTLLLRLLALAHASICDFFSFPRLLSFFFFKVLSSVSNWAGTKGHKKVESPWKRNSEFFLKEQFMLKRRLSFYRGIWSATLNDVRAAQV